MPAAPPVLVLDGFVFGSDVPTAAHGPLILTFATNVVASQSTSTPIVGIRLVGHTDIRGSERLNLDLGRRRADKVRQAIVRAMDRAQPGLSARISWTVDTLGESRPRSRTDHARNRRVEIDVTRRAAPPPRPTVPPPGPAPAPASGPTPRPRDARCPRGRFLRSGIWTRSTTLTVSGGQVMRFFLKNRNVLGTTITITAHTGERASRIILPMGSAEMEFSLFGCEPMGWRFDIDTNSDVFFVEWTLCSTWVPGDPRNC